MSHAQAVKIMDLERRFEALEKDFEATKEYIQTHDHGSPATPYVPLRVSEPSDGAVPPPGGPTRYGYK